MTTVLGWVAFVLLIGANAVFVAAEFSLTSVDRARLGRAVADGDPRAATMQRSVRTLSFQLSGAQLGITLCSLLLGFVSEPVVAKAVRAVFHLVGLSDTGVDAVALVIALVLATLAQMLFGELVPQNLAIARPLEVGRIIVPVQRAFTTVCRPVIVLFDGTANAIVRGLGVAQQEELRAARTPAELTGLIKSSAQEGTLAAPLAGLLRRMLSFSERTAAEVMTPRVQLVSLTVQDSVADLIRLARHSGHSRFPVHDGDLDDVLGVAHVRFALAVERGRRELVTVGDVMTPPSREPESLGCDVLLERLRADPAGLIVVVDEYGGTAGVVTEEDLIEELVGPVRDEHDVEERPDIVTLAPGVSLVAGRLHRDEFAERFDRAPAAGPFDTVAGQLMDALGRIPVVGDSVRWSGLTLRVASMDGRRVDRIEVIDPAVVSDADRPPTGGNTADLPAGGEPLR
jgi:CBS domain containing-hemolysin-like protein